MKRRPRFALSSRSVIEERRDLDEPARRGDILGGRLCRKRFTDHRQAGEKSNCRRQGHSAGDLSAEQGLAFRRPKSEFTSLQRAFGDLGCAIVPREIHENLRAFGNPDLSQAPGPLHC